MKRLIKSLFFSLKVLMSRKNDGAVILMYHSIAHSKAFFAVRPADFEKHMRLLKESGFECLQFSKLAERLAAGESVKKTVCVTFDDGYLDNYETALPILRKYGIPATIFVTTSAIGAAMTTSDGVMIPVMTENMIKELSNEGLIECMPHGEQHIRLGNISLEDAKENISISRTKIEALTGNRSFCFAYPYGNYTPELVSLLSSMGCQAAVTVERGSVSEQSDLLRLPRMPVDSQTPIFQLQYFLTQ